MSAADPSSSASPAEPHGPARTRIEDISTRWSAVSDPAQFVMRYGPAVVQYLEAILRDRHDAEEVAQDFLLRVVRGGLAGVDPERGRFRHYLKAAVRNSAIAHLRKRRSRPLSDAEAAGLADPGPTPEQEAERAWLDEWRQCVLNRVWRALETHERGSPGNLAFTALRLAAEHPGETSESLARRASERVGRALRADAFRQQLSRARKLFRRLLAEEVAGTLRNPTDEAVREELADIGLASFPPTGGDDGE
jgi:RNA polymerase sigma-70 factor (ECF subfamily)